MQQHQIVRGGVFDQPFHAAHDLVLPAVGLARRYEEAEHADPARAEDPAQRRDVFEHFKVRLEILVDADLAHRRTDRRDAHAAPGQLRLQRKRLIRRIGLYAAAVYAANLDGAEAGRLAHLQLGFKIRRNFIGKAGQ